MSGLLRLTLAVSFGAERLPFHSATYSADEVSRWIVSGSSAVPGNAHYIGGPAESEEREIWLAGLGLIAAGLLWHRVARHLARG